MHFPICFGSPNGWSFIYFSIVDSLKFSGESKNSATDFSVVEVYASQIRKLLRQYDYEKYLKTVRGIGYILTDDSELYG